MDSFDFVQSIKTEKANALARYRLFTNIAKAVQLIEALVAVALLSWSSTRLPLVLKLSTEYLFPFTSYLMNQHVVFLVGNVIVLFCYVLSRFTDSTNESNASAFQLHHDESNDDQLTRRKTVANPPNPKPLRLQATETPPETQILMIPNDKEIIKTETVTVTEPQVAAVTAIKQATKQIERFQRTQSDLKSKISVKNHSELRRSVTTERRRRTVASGELESMVKSIQTVDTLSDEDFRIAVEKFISKQQRIIKQQRMVEDGS